MQAERPKITGYACVPHEAVLPQHNELTEEKLDEEKFKSTLLNELQAEEHTMPALQEPFGISQVGVAHPLQDLKIEKSSIQTTSPFQSVVVPLKAPQLQISDEFYQMVSIYYSQEQARAETNRVLAVCFPKFFCLLICVGQSTFSNGQPGEIVEVFLWMDLFSNLNFLEKKRCSCLAWPKKHQQELVLFSKSQAWNIPEWCLTRI